MKRKEYLGRIPSAFYWKMNFVSCVFLLTVTKYPVSVWSQNANTTNSSGSTATSTQTTKKLSLETVVTTTTTTLSEKPTTILYELNTNYTPIIAVVGAGFGALVLFVCCTCVVHSWWLRKKKYTDVNSRSLSDAQRKQRKREEREAKKKEKEENTAEPSRFDMAYRKPPTVNERALANYDWARTSHLPGMLEPNFHDTNFTETIPKLICDDDDDDSEEGDLGQGNQGFDHGNKGASEPSSHSLSSFTSLFPKEEIESEPQEPIIVEPEMFESMEELPRPAPDGDAETDTALYHPQKEIKETIE